MEEEVAPPPSWLVQLSASLSQLSYCTAGRSVDWDTCLSVDQPPLLDWDAGLSVDQPPPLDWDAGLSVDQPLPLGWDHLEGKDMFN